MTGLKELLVEARCDSVQWRAPSDEEEAAGGKGWFEFGFEAKMGGSHKVYFSVDSSDRNAFEVGQQYAIVMKFYPHEPSLNELMAKERAEEIRVLTRHAIYKDEAGNQRHFGCDGLIVIGDDKRSCNRCEWESPR